MFDLYKPTTPRKYSSLRPYSGGLHHNNKIPPDYTRVEVHFMKLEFMQWKIDHPTPEELTLLGEVMNQFILWHKQDIVLIASSSPVQRLEAVVTEPTNL